MSVGSDRWHEIDALFETVLGRPVDDRSGFLSEACGDDVELRAEVEALLRAHEASDEYWRESGDPLVARVRAKLGTGSDEDSDTRPETRPDRVGPYRLVRSIGRGGMGTVYLAERQDGEFDQRVAVKLLRRGLDTDDVVRRFRAERQILASLDHPNIARLIDGGSTEDGRPYLVMEYVEGTPITEYCDEHQVSIPRRLTLFETVLKAVRHAHRHLVIHRDIKPSNILVSESGEVKLLDFGIAKLLDDDEEGLTRTGVRLLTPGYASPEQLADEPVTTGSDVFQLGLLLYELLTGLRPFGDKETSPREIERQTLETPLERPSKKVCRLAGMGLPEVDGIAELATRRGLQPEGLARTLANDLDDIVSMALRREADDRYPSVDPLLSDLEAHRTGLPVSASSGALRYRARKFARRHRWGVTAAAALVAIVAGYIATISVQSRSIAEERDRAQAAAARAEQIAAFMTSVFGGADPVQTLGDTVTARQLLERGVDRIDTELADEPDLRAEMLVSLANVYSSLGSYETAVELIERAIEIRRGESAGDPEKLAFALFSLGTTRSAGRFWTAAREPLREALSIREELYGSTDPRWAKSARSLALVERELVRPDSAVALMRAVVEVYRQDPGEESAEFVQSLNALALTLRSEGELDEAEALYREALPTLRALHGERDVTALPSTLNNLAFLLRPDEPAEAAGLYQESLDILAEIYGRGHPRTLVVSGNLSVLRWEALGDIDGAIELARDNVRAAEIRWPDGHWRVGGVYRALGITFLHGNAFVEADSALTQAVSIFDEQLGPLHSWTARALAWVAVCRALQGKATEAERLFADVLLTLQPGAEEGLFPEFELDRIRYFIAFLEERGLDDRAAEFRGLLPAGSNR